MGNVWLILGSEKDQDWYKWLLNHDFRRWYCVDNSARVCAFKGTENKARASVHAGGAEFLIHLWALIDCECGGKWACESITLQANQVHFLQSILWQIHTASSCQK